MSYYAIGNSSILTCTVDNPCKGCTKFQAFKLLRPLVPAVADDGKVWIGWCKRFEPDPKQGYVYKRTVPPCVAWGYESKREKGVR